MGVVSADKIIPTKQSESEDWIAWYKSFPFMMTREDKNILFLSTWRKNGSEKANTNDLRTFLKDQAGINLTTDGIGSIIDLGGSIVSSIESVFKISAYSFAGIVILWLVFMGFLGYQAFKNPEATGKIIGIAGKAALKA